MYQRKRKMQHLNRKINDFSTLKAFNIVLLQKEIKAN